MLKYLIGYNDNDVIRPFCIKFSQMIGYVKHFNSNKTMSFKVIDNNLLKKYTKLRERVSSLMNIVSDRFTVYGDYDKYIKTKIKPYGDKMDTNFQGKKNTKRKCIIEVFAIDNVRLPY